MGDMTKGWKKSSYSQSNGHCVEAASLAAEGRVGVRDSKKEGGGPVLLFEPEAWSAFLSGLRLQP
jgi:Domain of unknown function (DUF397)